MTDLSVATKLLAYTVVNKVRFVTAASLFDGHDASINIMRRILMANGAEVIHLGHNRSWTILSPRRCRRMRRASLFPATKAGMSNTSST